MDWQAEWQWSVTVLDRPLSNGNYCLSNDSAIVLTTVRPLSWMICSDTSISSSTINYPHFVLKLTITEGFWIGPEIERIGVASKSGECCRRCTFQRTNPEINLEELIISDTLGFHLEEMCCGHSPDMGQCVYAFNTELQTPHISMCMS